MKKQNRLVIFVKNLILYAAGLYAIYLILSLVWGVLNIQSCKGEVLSENATCEEIVESHVKNCKYVILKWKMVDYEKELRKCKRWEEKNKENNLTDIVSFDCRSIEFTEDNLKEFVDEANIDLEISEKLVDLFNSKPLCIDYCTQQLEYSKDYPDEWFAENDLRKTCRDLGIELP